MSAPVWVDAHCHLQLDSDPGAATAEAQITRAVAAGVAWMVCVGVDLESSHRAVDLAARHPEVYAAVGLHPHEASRLGAEWSMLEVLAQADRVVAVGEAGLDYHYMHAPADEQEQAFRFQIRLAKRLDRALVIHSRSAWDDTFAILEDEGPPPRTVFHCFTGGPDEARRALGLGAALSFSGIVSFPSAEDVRAAAALVPDDRLLVETDAPYLAPVPLRGRPNEPANVVRVGAALAAARAVEPDAVAAVTAATAARCFGVA